MVSRTIQTALIAGTVAGICLFLFQRELTLPLIHKAESIGEAAHEEFTYDPFVREPARSLSTLLGDVLMGIGFGLILNGVLAATGKEGCLPGLLVGAAGFITFDAAPALVVPPAVPGMEVAPLTVRQIGWFAAVISAAVGLTTIYRGKSLVRLIGVLIIIAPPVAFRLLLLDAPHRVVASDSLERLDNTFIGRTLACMLVFWTSVGIVSGYLLSRARKQKGLLELVRRRS